MGGRVMVRGCEDGWEVEDGWEDEDGWEGMVGGWVGG